MRRSAQLLALTILLAATPALAADIGLTPPRLALVAPPGGTVTATFSVVTTSPTEQFVETAASDWLLDVAGDLTFVPPGTAPYSAAPWLTLDAGAFALPPTGSRELRLEVAVPPDAEGTHHAMVFVTVVPPPTETPGVGVTTTTRVGLTVYVTVSGTERSGSEFVDFYQPDAATLAAVVVNTGNTVMRLGGVVELRDEAGDVVHRFPVPNTPVLRESEREIRFELPADLEPGFYVALALIEDDRGGLLAGELPLEVP
jgi:hypothetical protein